MGPFRGGRVSVIVAALVFSQRLGSDHILSKNDFEDIRRGIEKFNNNDEIGFKKFVQKYQKEQKLKNSEKEQQENAKMSLLIFKF